MALAFESIPAPPGLPLIGNLHEWIGVGRAEEVLTRLRDQAERSGPLLRLPLGPANVLVIADAELAASTLGDERANYKGLSYILTRAVLDNVLLLNGETWSRHRALYRKALREVDVLGPTRRHCDALVARLAGSSTIDLASAIPSLFSDIVADFVAGVRIPSTLEPSRARVQHELAALGIELIARPWGLLSPGRWRALKKSVAEVASFFADVVRSRRGDKEPRADVLGSLLELQGAGELPDEGAVVDAVVNFFFTAHEVLATSTLWALDLLARHPQAQDGLAQSLRTASDPAECAELGMVLRESLRLYPAYALFGRTTQQELIVAGHTVPRGTFLVISPFVIHRVSRNFPDAQLFRPERFAGRGHSPIVSAPAEQYVPFGVGPRACLATHLAVPMMKAAIATLVSALELRAAPEQAPRIRYWGTVHPRDPRLVAVRPRSASYENAGGPGDGQRVYNVC